MGGTGPSWGSASRGHLGFGNFGGAGADWASRRDSNDREDLTESGQYLIFNFNVQINRKGKLHSKQLQRKYKPQNRNSSKTEETLPRSMQGGARRGVARTPGPHGGTEGATGSGECARRVWFRNSSKFPSYKTRIWTKCLVDLSKHGLGDPGRDTLALESPRPRVKGFANLEFHR